MCDARQADGDAAHATAFRDESPALDVYACGYKQRDSGVSTHPRFMIDADELTMALGWLKRGAAVCEADARIDRAWDVAKRMSQFGMDRTWQAGLTEREMFACLHFAVEMLQLASDGKCDMDMEYDAVYAALCAYRSKK